MLAITATLALWVQAAGSPPSRVQRPAPEVVVENPAPAAVRRVVTASFPVPRGGAGPDDRWAVGAVPAAAEILLRWPDGSPRVVQLQWPEELPPNARLVRPVRWGRELEAPDPARDGRAWHFDGELPFRSELEDPWGRAYQARFVPDETAGAGGWLRRSAWIGVRRYRAVHTGTAGAFLGLRGYLVTARGERRAELTVVLDNTGDVGPVFGPVRLRRFSLCSERRALRFRPWFSVENLLRPPQRLEGGGWRQDLLGPSDHLYLGDRTAKAFRFELFDSDGAGDEERAAARWQFTHPVTAFAGLDWTRATGAWGCYGGPAPLLDAEDPTVAAAAAAAALSAWRHHAGFGPFGGFGDPPDAAAPGTARSSPMALHSVLRWRSPALLRTAVAMVLQQALRPTPGRRPRLPAATAPWRAGLAARSLERPHGFTALDYEHFSVDLPSDLYWLTGDPFARDELARAGRGLRDVLAALPFRTSRGEGWSLQAGVAIARATADGELLEVLARRVVRELLPGLGPPGSGHAVLQPPHADAFGDGVPFDAPWQMAILVHGLAALDAEIGDPRIRAAIVRIAREIATTGWDEERGPRYLVHGMDPGESRDPPGFEPMTGTAWFEIGAFVLAEECALEDSDRSLFRRRADALLVGPRAQLPAQPMTHPWFQIPFDRRRRP